VLFGEIQHVPVLLVPVPVPWFALVPELPAVAREAEVAKVVELGSTAPLPSWGSGESPVEAFAVRRAAIGELTQLPPSFEAVPFQMPPSPINAEVFTEPTVDPGDAGASLSKATRALPKKFGQKVTPVHETLCSGLNPVGSPSVTGLLSTYV
jgi:hypothetical protein